MKLLFILLLFLSCFSCKEQKKSSISFNKELATVETLKNHSHEFRKEIIQVTEGIHVAVGYGLANSILIEGSDGVVIVDCLESMEAAKVVKEDFLKITNKPVKAIIYTHNHADHIFGAKAMAGDDTPAIYAHELTNYYIDRLLNVVRPIITVRSARMFGLNLDEAGLVNCGIGKELVLQDENTIGLLRPTKTFEKELAIKIADIKIKLVHAPGETNDQLFVWLPEKKVLLPGDNVYKSFPNLYTIRGTPYRDVKAWSSSIDKMRYLNPEFLIPSHTRPLIGKDTIRKVLTTYRDAIQFIHDQTIRNINKQMTPDELVETVQLPPHLRNSPWLEEFYGMADWSIRSIFDGYLGFFDGNPTTLFTMPPVEKAKEMASLAGGESKLLQQAKDALEANKYQWTLELTDYLKLLNVEPNTVKNIRYQVLTALGEQQINTNARHYYLTAALEEKGLVVNDTRPIQIGTARSIPIKAIFENMSVRLIPEKSTDLDQKVVFHFEDLKEEWTIHVRRGVAEIQPFALPDPDLKVSINSIIWKELVAKFRNGLATYAKGEIKFEHGGIRDFGKFMDLFNE